MESSSPLRKRAQSTDMVLSALAVFVLGSCEPDSGPGGAGGPDFRFEPGPGELTAVINDTLSFRVLDARSRPVVARYYRDGSLVATAERFDHIVEQTRPVRILARAVANGTPREASWVVEGVVLRFDPSEGDLWMATGQALKFAVLASDRSSLRVSFLQNGIPVSDDAHHTLTPTVPGSYRIEAWVLLDGFEQEKIWDVTATTLIAKPPAGLVPVRPYDAVTLSIERADGRPLDAEFSVDGSVFEKRTGVRYEATSPGSRAVRVRVPTSAGNAMRSWDLVDASPVPPSVGIVVRPRSIEPAIDVSWSVDPVRGAQSEPDSCQIAWSTVPFSVHDRDRVEFVVVPYVPGQASQEFTITGLRGLTTYHFRVFGRDQDGQIGFGTVLASARTADPGDLVRVTGSVKILPESGPPSSVEGARVAIWRVEQATEAAGSFALEAMSNGAQFLSITTPDATPMEVGPLPRADVRYELLLLPSSPVELVTTSATTSVPLCEYIARMTSNDHPLDEDPTFHRWSHYPVKVWVWEFTSDAGEQPAFHDAFRRGIDRWNDGATGDDRLLEYVAVEDSLFDPSSQTTLEGVFIRLYPEGGSRNLAEVTFVRPGLGKVAADDPELLKITLRRSLPTQYLVDRVVTHELGHVLGLVHSPSLADLMHGTADLAAGIPRSHEIGAARFLRHVARGTSSHWYLRDAP